MQQNSFKNPIEDKKLIIAGILVFYFIVVLFVALLYMLHRLTPVTAAAAVALFSGVYCPQFLIIKKIINGDKITILDDALKINEQIVGFNTIEDYRIEEKNPRVVFVINAQTVVFYEGIFHLKLTDGTGISFSVTGSEKIALLKKFFDELLNHY